MQERTNRRAETSLGIVSARPGRGFPLGPTFPAPHRGRSAEPGWAAARRGRVGCGYRDLLAEAEPGPGLGIQRRWEKTGSAGGDGLAVQSRRGEKPSGRRRMTGGGGGVGRGESPAEKKAKSPPKGRCRRRGGGSHPGRRAKRGRGWERGSAVGWVSRGARPARGSARGSARGGGVGGCCWRGGMRDAGCGEGGGGCGGAGGLLPPARPPAAPLLRSLISG